MIIVPKKYHVHGFFKVTSKIISSIGLRDVGIKQFLKTKQTSQGDILSYPANSVPSVFEQHFIDI